MGWLNTPSMLNASPSIALVVVECMFKTSYSCIRSKLVSLFKRPFKVHQNREKMKCRRRQMFVSKSDGDGADHDGQVMKIYGSDGESNWSQESSLSSKRPKGAVNSNSNDKKKASRGSATDPQSVYARKRRERINERLRILQKLVPNGTKVDISTMLEEAVQYVKFLQLQIKIFAALEL